MVRAMSRPSSRLRDTNRSPLCTIWSSISTNSAVTCLALPLTTTATRSLALIQRPALASGGCETIRWPRGSEQVAQVGFRLLLLGQHGVDGAQHAALCS